MIKPSTFTESEGQKYGNTLQKIALIFMLVIAKFERGATYFAYCNYLDKLLYSLKA